MPAGVPATTVARRNTCSKCRSTKKSGKLSCCARGGAWFKNCGDAGERKFDHTWAEGIQACKGFWPNVPFKAAGRHVGLINTRVNMTKSRNCSHQQAKAYRRGSMSNVAAADSTDYIRLAKMTVYSGVFLLAPHYLLT